MARRKRKPYKPLFGADAKGRLTVTTPDGEAVVLSTLPTLPNRRDMRGQRSNFSKTRVERWQHGRTEQSAPTKPPLLERTTARRAKSRAARRARRAAR